MSMMFHPGQERGHANHGWLDTHHSFSFARWHHPGHMGIGPLRVLNQDRIVGGSGFPSHGHRDMEIISIVLEGALEHRDSSGNHTVIEPGEIQVMSAGTGVTHSEMNHLTTTTTEFLQIWVHPDRRGLPMSYQQRRLDPKVMDAFPVLLSPDGRGASLRLHQDALVLGGSFDEGSHANHRIPSDRVGYVHLSKGRARINGREVEAGDGAYLPSGGEVEFLGSAPGHVLVFDLCT